MIASRSKCCIAAEAKQITLDALIHPPPGQAAPDLPLRAGDIVIVGTFVPGHVHPEPGAAWQDVGR